MEDNEYIAETLRKRQGHSAAAIAAKLGMTREETYSRMVALGYRKPEPWATWEVDLIKELWGKPDESASTIALKLNNKSRNAVIGKAHRLKLVTQPRPPKKNILGLILTAPRLKRERKAKGEKMPPLRLPPDRPIADIEPISIMQLNASTCRAVVGSGCDGLARYCGDEVFPGQSYCPAHCSIYFQESKRRAY